MTHADVELPKTRIEEVKETCGKATKIDEFDNGAETWKDQHKEIFVPPMKELMSEGRQYRGFYNRAKSQIEKVSRAKVSGGSGQTSSGVMAELVVRAAPTLDGSAPAFPAHGVASVFSEFLKDAPALLSQGFVEQACDEIVALPYYQKQLGWLQKHTKSTKTNIAQVSVVDEMRFVTYV